jgi:poly(3-hydroxybutyrate) depolymerase
MRLGPGLLALTLLLAALGCGGESETLTRPTSEGPIGKGASGIWIYRPAGKPKDLVIYLHGQGGPSEARPDNHLPWIKHLVSRGSVVLYPRYEMEYEAEPMQFIANGIRTAENRVDLDDLPVLVIGYSRGGGLAVEYAAVAAEEDLPVPDAIMSVFPAGFGNANEQVDLSPIPHTTEILFLVGDQDTVVDTRGAAFTGSRLQDAGFPGENIHLDLVESRGNFAADHFAPMSTTPAARAAFWEPADRILDALDED